MYVGQQTVYTDDFHNTLLNPIGIQCQTVYFIPKLRGVLDAVLLHENQTGWGGVVTMV